MYLQGYTLSGVPERYGIEATTIYCLLQPVQVGCLDPERVPLPGKLPA